MGILKNIFGLIFIFTIVAGYYVFFHSSGIGFLNFGEAEQNKPLPIGKILSSVIAMLFGILFGALYDQIFSKKRSISLKNEIIRLSKSPRLFRSLLASPVLFVGVYVAAKSQPDMVIALIFAFQNGFFCDAIMKEKADKPKSL